MRESSSESPVRIVALDLALASTDHAEFGGSLTGAVFVGAIGCSQTTLEVVTEQKADTDWLSEVSA